MRAPDFGARAARYDELRPVDENWWELFDALVRAGDLRGRRVLEVGCGTGTLATALAEQSRVWAVDSSPEMIDVARARNGGDRVGWRVADATALPFRAGWFERVVMRLVVHLVDRPRAFAEALRVLVDDGRLVIATFDPAHFDRYWLNELFPSLERIDRARFPTPEALESELRAAGFARVELTRLRQSAEISRDAALEKVRGKHISTFDLIDDEEFEAGLARAERELTDPVGYSLEWLIAVATARAT
ncbi:MAG: methyltransferase domain-containing protein [Actinobacteria bacterium]|nr:MAG: methyltransferase domain-containing protein [Actinomycetota bacterium]